MVSARCVGVVLALGATACGWGHSVAMLRETRPFLRRQALAITADLPAGKIRLERGRSQDLYELQFSYCRTHFAAESRFLEADPGDAGGGEASLRLSAREISPSTPADQEPNLLLLRLRPGLPLDLLVAAGRGEITADLSALSVRRMDVHGGTGPLQLSFRAGNPALLEQLRIVAGSGPVRLEGLGWGNVTSLQFYGGAGPALLEFSGPGPDEAVVLLDPGTGGVELALPRELGVEISGRGVDPHAPPEGLLAGEKTWASANRARAERHLTVVLDRPSTSLRVRWLP